MADKRTAAQDRRLKFWNDVVYSSLAPLYNSMDWLTFGAWWRLVSRALDYVPEGGRMLEVAFGPGRLHVELAKRAELCAGLDLAKGMCRFTDQRIKREKLASVITRGSVFDLPYPTGYFDTVVSTFAFSGFPEGERAMRELARVVKSGGRLVLVDIALPDDGNRLGTTLARTWEKMGDFLYPYTELMQQAGLQVAVCEEFGPGKHIRAIVGEKPS